MKKHIIFFTACLIAILILHNRLFSQETLMLHAMREIPQSGMANPAYIPAYTAHFSLLIPGMALSIGHSGFAWNDLVNRRADDSLYLDFDKAIKSMNNNNYLHSSFRLEPFSFGLRFGYNYLTLASSVRTDITLLYPKQFFELITTGNVGLIGQESRLKDFKGIGSAWIEHSIGYARQINEEFNAGIKLKIITGLANVHLARNQVEFSTDNDMYDLTLNSDFLLHTSFPTEDEFHIPRNRGFGIDLGMTWKPVENVILSAGVNDLGRISWRENSYAYRSKDNSTITFSGLELSDFFNTEDEFDSGFDALADSLENIFVVEEFSKNYSTPLPATFHIGANYKLTDDGQIGALLYLKNFEKQLIPSASLIYHHNFGHIFAATAAVSYHNRSFYNLGLGGSLSLGFFQMYVLSGNVISLLTPHKVQNAGIQFGINFLIGRHDKQSTPMIIIEEDSWDTE